MPHNAARTAPGWRPVPGEAQIVTGPHTRGLLFVMLLVEYALGSAVDLTDGHEPVQCVQSWSVARVDARYSASRHDLRLPQVFG